jgi:uncharacterized membrane protein YbhN (UPF0104 family)
MSNESNSNIYRKIIKVCLIVASICFLSVLAISIVKGFNQINILMLFLSFVCSISTLILLIIKRK